MTEASGRITATTSGIDLAITRSIALPVDEAWAYITDSPLTEQWFGPWEGDARAGGAVRVRMRFEDHEPAIGIRILACEAPERLVLKAEEEVGGWHLEMFVEADGDDALVTLVHHLDDAEGVGEIGPGWEYYLDLLVAATEGTERPGFDAYYPALREAYLEMRP